MTKFTALTDKQKKDLVKHKEKYGLTHYRRMRAKMMRGETVKEAHKYALSKKDTVVVKKSKKNNNKPVEADKYDADNEVEVEQKQFVGEDVENQ